MCCVSGKDEWEWVEEVNSSSSVSLLLCITFGFFGLLALLVNGKQDRGDNARRL